MTANAVEAATEKAAQQSMISVVIPTLNAGSNLAACLTALVPASIDGFVGDVIIADGGSTDRTVDIAADAGCTVLRCKKAGRGSQLIDGVALAKRHWILILHADSVLAPGWHEEAAAFVRQVDAKMLPPSAASFQFALADKGFAPRLVALGVALRCRVFRLPFGDQGLLISRELYDAIGGYADVPLMEDVILIGRIARSRRVNLSSKIVTSAVRYQTDGYLRRIGRNWLCLGLHFCGVSAQRIDRLYRR